MPTAIKGLNNSLFSCGLFLLLKGVKRHSNYRESKLVGDNGTVEGRKQNRRVEVKFSK